MNSALPMIDELRARGMQVLVYSGWAVVGLVALISLWLRPEAAIPIAFTGALVLAGPSWMLRQRRHDRQARLVLSTLAAALPALPVYLLQGHVWQMDAHMYFFVALASLTILCDWRPIVLASGLVAVHHLALQWMAPAWVFNGDRDLARVMFHALAVVLQCGVLVGVTRLLRTLLYRQEQSLAETRALAERAEREHRIAADALAQAQRAEAEAAAERALREASERDAAARRRSELVQLAGEFEAGVSTVAGAIETAAQQLETASTQLHSTARRAMSEAEDVSVGTAAAVHSIREVAHAITGFGKASEAITAGAGRQVKLARTAAETGRDGAAAIAAMQSRAEQIGTLLDQIRQVAATTNLLALNATIEAARAGEAGRGFAVVAGEIKTLAADASQASDRIAALIEAIRGGVASTGEAIARATANVSDVSQAAAAIASEAAAQQDQAGTVHAVASRVVEESDAIQERIGQVALAITDAGGMSAQVQESATALSATARTLRAATDGFIFHLRTQHG